MPDDIDAILSALERRAAQLASGPAPILGKRERCIRWAQERIERRFSAISVQTTGLNDPRPVHIVVINSHSGALWQTLVNPGAAIHGLKDTDVANAPDFAHVYPQLAARIEGADLVNYGARFHREVLESAAKRCGAPDVIAHWSDLMHIYAHYVGTRTRDDREYRPWPFAEACRALGVPLAGTDGVSKARAIVAAVEALAKKGA